MLVWLFSNVVVETSCLQQRQRVELHGIHYSVWWLFLVSISFSLLWMVLVPIIQFKLVPLSDGYNENPAKSFLQLWFACNTCQCFVRISFKFGNARLCFTDNGMYRSSRRFCWCSSCFRLNILIEFDVLGCREYFSLKSMDVPISHWESFDGHLILGKSSL